MKNILVKPTSDGSVNNPSSCFQPGISESQLQFFLSIQLFGMPEHWQPFSTELSIRAILCPSQGEYNLVLADMASGASLQSYLNHCRHCSDCSINSLSMLTRKSR